MRTGERPAIVAFGLVALFLVSLAPLTHHQGSALGLETEQHESTPLGQSQKLTIGSWPDGANQRVELSVPDGHSIKSVDLNITAGTLGNSIATNLSQLGDFDGNTVYDGMDVNKSSLHILPQDWRYDFESGTWAPAWTR